MDKLSAPTSMDMMQERRLLAELAMIQLLSNGTVTNINNSKKPILHIIRAIGNHSMFQGRRYNSRYSQRIR